MPKSESSSPLIDLDQAARLYPGLRQSAENLEILLGAYLDEDHFFRRSFTGLFPDRSFLLPPLGPMAEDPVQKTLLRLAGLAHVDELVSRAALQLDLNNDRAAQTCVMLDLLLQGRRPRLDG